MPTGVYRAVPEWSTCIDDNALDRFDIWDPPRVLHSVTALDAPIDKLTTESKHTMPSHTLSSAIEGPGLEIPVPEITRSTATYDETRSAVSADPHLQTSSNRDQNGNGQKKSNTFDDSSSTGGIAQVSEVQVSLKSLPSITAIVYTTHYLSTDPSSSSSANQGNTNIMTLSSTHHENQASNDPDLSSSTENLDNPNHPTRPHSSIATSSCSTIHPQDPTSHSKASDTAHAQASTAGTAKPQPSLSTEENWAESPAIRTTSPAVSSSNNTTDISAWIMANFAKIWLTAHAQASTAGTTRPQPSLSTKEPSGASSTIRTTSPAALSSNKPTGIAAWIMAGFDNRLTNIPSSTQQQHPGSSSPPLRTATATSPATPASTTLPHASSNSTSRSATHLGSGTSWSTNLGFTGQGSRYAIRLGEMVILASSLLLLLLLLG